MSEEDKSLKPETIALHTGQEPDPTTNARAVPIYQTVSYNFNDAQHAQDLFALAEPGNIYTRIMNPTWNVLEERMTALEGGVAALAVASGTGRSDLRGDERLPVPATTSSRSPTSMAAPTTCSPTPCRSTGSRSASSTPTSPDELAGHVDEKTKMVFAETIGNPRLNVVDLDAWSDAAHAEGLPLAVDNTVPTPILCRVVRARRRHRGPLGDQVHRWPRHLDRRRDRRLGQVRLGRPAGRYPGLTKPDPSYHGVVWTDAMGPAAYVGRVRTVLLRNTGAALSPFNAFLLLQGIETLPLRMERHCENAMAVAEHLKGHRRGQLGRVPGPGGLQTTPKSPRGSSMAVAGRWSPSGSTVAATRAASSSTRSELFSHLANIGDAKSLAIHPATTTHSQLDEGELGQRRRHRRHGPALGRHREHRRHPGRHRPGPGQGEISRTNAFGRRPRRNPADGRL